MAGRGGWYKEVQVKSVSCHEIRAVLNSRAQLVKIKRDIKNQIRGLLKNLGFVIGKAGGTVFRHPRHRLGHQHNAQKMPWFPNPRRGVPLSPQVLYLICETIGNNLEAYHC